MASHQQLHPAGDDRACRRARGVRADAAGRVWRPGARQGVDVRRLRGTVARLYRRRQPRHPFGNRGGAHSRQRHRRAEAQVAAEDRHRRGSPDGGVHRAEHRVRPRLAENPGGARGRRLQGLRQQDLDHPSGARRSHDPPGADQPEGSRLPGPVHAARRKAARDGSRIRSRRRACRAPRSRCSAIAG